MKRDETIRGVYDRTSDPSSVCGATLQPKTVSYSWTGSPFPLREDIFNSSHQLHKGVRSPTNRIKLTSWWPTLRRDARQWISSCPKCSTLRPFQEESRNQPSCKPFKRLYADWCHIPDVGNVLMDVASGWIECSLPQQRTTSNVIDSLSAVFSKFGVPRFLVTDNAAEFMCRSHGTSRNPPPSWSSAVPSPPESCGFPQQTMTGPPESVS